MIYVSKKDTIVDKVLFISDLRSELLDESVAQWEVKIDDKVYLITRNDNNDCFVVDWEDMVLEEVLSYFIKELWIKDD